MKISRHTIVLFALGLTLTAIGLAGAQSRPVVSSSLTMGRYQIVNPTPESITNATLLDTATGQTWITCKDGETPGWCPMYWHKTYAEMERAARR